MVAYWGPIGALVWPSVPSGPKGQLRMRYHRASRICVAVFFAMQSSHKQVCTSCEPTRCSRGRRPHARRSTQRRLNVPRCTSAQTATRAPRGRCQLWRGAARWQPASLPGAADCRRTLGALEKLLVDRAAARRRTAAVRRSTTARISSAARGLANVRVGRRSGVIIRRARALLLVAPWVAARPLVRTCDVVDALDAHMKVVQESTDVRLVEGDADTLAGHRRPHALDLRPVHRHGHHAWLGIVGLVVIALAFAPGEHGGG